MMLTQRAPAPFALRAKALLVAALLAAPLCLTPVAASARQDDPKPGMSTKKKVVLLVGAAALFYMWKRHKDAKNETAKVQYYRSEKTGRIYYRDPKTHQAHWVTPPTAGISVSEDDAQEFSRYRGYNSSTSGRAFGGY